MSDISEMMEEWRKDLRAKELETLAKRLEATGCKVDRDTGEVTWPHQLR